MISSFFINRPIFASVISILTVIAGVVAYLTLPISQYPDLTPPVIQVSAMYPGASSQTVADTVAAPIEQQVNGVDGMLYMESTSGNDGSYTLSVTFALGTDPDMATVLVQNRVGIAAPQLPQDVQRQGVTTQKKSTNMIGIVSVYAQDPGNDESLKKITDRYDDTFLVNFTNINIKDTIARIPGVGGVSVFPIKDYSMRIWVDPQKLQSRNMDATDVINAIKKQNVQVAAGTIGAPPAPSNQETELVIKTQGRLTTGDEFENIIVKSEQGRITYLKDVARVELGGKLYNIAASRQGKPSAVMIVYQSPGGNAVDAAEKTKAALLELEKSFPTGIKTSMSYDVSDFILASIDEVYKTFAEAVILVVIVVLVFLQSFRATIVPVITIPVAIVGTFVFMALFGFSINTLTLFGLILAIGIVVDDAIVVVENVERIMTSEHLPAKEATRKAMNEITGAIIAISLVLMAVFLPTLMLPGLPGQMYKQFALTIAASTFLSAVNALTLSPALCSVLLKPHDPNHKPFILSRAFNYCFDKLALGYSKVVHFLCTKYVIGFSLAAFAAVLFATYHAIMAVPTGFIPNEDRGLLLVNVQLPDGASLERTRAVLKEITDVIKPNGKLKPGYIDFNTLAGYSLLSGNGTNTGSLFAMLEPWDVRYKDPKQGLGLRAMIQNLQIELNKIPEAQIIVFSLPPIDGLGTGSGFDMRLLDQAGLGGAALMDAATSISMQAYATPELMQTYSSFRAYIPQLYAQVDRQKVMQMGIPLDAVNGTLQTYLGGAYVNDFNLFGRTFQVTLQADQPYRMTPDQIGRLQVRNPENQKMVPLSTFTKVTETYGPDKITRYNLYPSAQITGQPAPGVSSGQSLDIMEGLAAQTLPQGMSYAWTATAYQEKQAGSGGYMVFVGAAVVVYLILAALYESWSQPMSVLLSVPMVILGAMLLCMQLGEDNNIFTQIGLVLLVGLGAKNAILIVEFARDNRAKGMPIIESAVDAARMRLRPILMTSFAFILGCVPLILSKGAGAAGRIALGTAVVGGMVGQTILGLIFVPVLYVTVQGISEAFGGGKSGIEDHKPTPAPATPATH
jgi:hydrophobic/amphiphilic exporter-1 (mainly G- bacteria), HAE1 family